MTRISGWKPIVDRVHKKLSNWKCAILSIGGRAMLIKSVLGAPGVYFMSLF